MRSVGLADVRHRTVADLRYPLRYSKLRALTRFGNSGGMRRRLSVAVALVGDPEIVFLDEPSTGLDPDSRRQLWEVLLRVREQKILILTTHSMEEADVLCTR